MKSIAHNRSHVNCRFSTLRRPFKLVIASIASWLYVVGATQAAPPRDAGQQMVLELEIADAFHVYMEGNQAKAWNDVLKGAQAVAYYLPDERIEGETLRTRRRLHLFECMDGTACLPSPHIEKQVAAIDRRVIAPARVGPQAPGGPLTLRFELPVSPAKNYYFSSVEVQVPAGELWRREPFASWGKSLPKRGRELYAKQRNEPLRISMQDAGQGSYDYALADLKGFTPGQLRESSSEVIGSLRARLLLPDGSERIQAFAVGRQFSDWTKENPGALESGKIPEGVKAMQMPLRLQSSYVSTRYSVIAMPEIASRWHGLHHHNFPAGVRVSLAKSGPLSQLDIVAEAGNHRKIDGRAAVKSERWFFYNDKLTSYHGQIHYGNNADDKPATQWYISWHDGRRLDASAEQVSAGIQGRSVPHCQNQGCHDNLAEARGQLARSDEYLQREASLYLNLAERSRSK